MAADNPSYIPHAIVAYLGRIHVENLVVAVLLMKVRTNETEKLLSDVCLDVE